MIAAADHLVVAWDRPGRVRDRGRGDVLRGVGWQVADGAARDRIVDGDLAVALEQRVRRDAVDVEEHEPFRSAREGVLRPGVAGPGQWEIGASVGQRHDLGRAATQRAVGVRFRGVHRDDDPDVRQRRAGGDALLLSPQVARAGRRRS